MGDLFDVAEGLIGRRRLTSTWLPVLLLVVGLTVLVAFGIGWQQVDQWWDSKRGVEHAGLVTLAVFGWIIIAEVLAAIRPSAIRLYCGDWSSEWLTNRQKRAADPHRPWLSPSLDRMRPTRIGNALVAATQEAERYGMDAATAWPRLYPVLPDSFQMLLGQAANRLELSIAISMLGGFFTVVGGAIATVLCPWYVTIAVIATGTVTAWSGYRRAILAADRYGNFVRAAFDVHRWLLIDAMGLRRPTSYTAELAQWQQLHQIWQRGRPDSGEDHHLGYPTE